MANQQQPLTVTELTRRIKQTLEGGYPSVLVEGEISNVRRHTSGHLYFTLKDEGAQLSGVMWRSRVSGLRFEPEDGMKVIVAGRISVYEPRGAYQIDAQSMRPLGVGDLQIAFEKLKQKLAAEGLFDEARKKPLPPFPRRIGIITSPTGAVIQDIRNVISRRFPSLEAVLCPVPVQGPGAAKAIATAIDDCNRIGGIDVLIVARGGGSLEDLWAFNEEIVARALSRSLVPVVSAVGHETDFTIADFVADLRAPTPSAAAELVVPDRRELLENVTNSWYRLHDAVLEILNRQRDRIHNLLTSYAFNRPLDLLRQHSQRVDELHRSLLRTVEHGISLTSARYAALGQHLQALDPRRALQRGFAIVRKAGEVVSSRALLKSRDAVEIEFRDGSVRSTIT
ncbi:MAG: exodeoxyribonuclease VII large subunit [Bacteroidota bacterium]